MSGAIVSLIFFQDMPGIALPPGGHNGNDSSSLRDKMLKIPDSHIPAGDNRDHAGSAHEKPSLPNSIVSLKSYFL